MKLARGIARAIGALVVVIGMTLGVGTAEAVAPTGGLIRVQAWVDGRSQLVLQGDTARWHHFDYAAPGRLGFANAPTTIDGVDWSTPASARSCAAVP